MWKIYELNPVSAFILTMTMFKLNISFQSVVAVASQAIAPINNFMTWDFLGTMTGAIAATTLIVQFLKIPLDKVWKIHTRYVVYAIALLLLFLVEFFTGHITLERIILIMLNAIVVAMASMGTYEVTFKQIETKSTS